MRYVFRVVIISLLLGLIVNFGIYKLTIKTLSVTSASTEVMLCVGGDNRLFPIYVNESAGIPLKSTATEIKYVHSCSNIGTEKGSVSETVYTWQFFADWAIYSVICFGAIKLYENYRH
jgi:hypothetical protein